MNIRKCSASSRN